MHRMSSDGQTVMRIELKDLLRRRDREHRKLDKERATSEPDS
jgi:hypothetical protein